MKPYDTLHQVNTLSMNIFLIRHGQTLLNQSNTHQYSTTPLSDIGMTEANSIAQRLKEAEIDIIYSSPLLRAKQTAEAIAQSSNKTITFLDELREIKRPSVIEGKCHSDKIVKQIKQDIKNNYAHKDWHHSDEENFWDLRYRVEALRSKLQRETTDNILLVSHGVVIKMFLSLCIFDDRLTADTFLDFYENVFVSNTGISHCSFSSELGWKVVRVNDTTHLKVS